MWKTTGKNTQHLLYVVILILLEFCSFVSTLHFPMTMEIGRCINFHAVFFVRVQVGITNSRAMLEGKHVLWIEKCFRKYWLVYMLLACFSTIFFPNRSFVRFSSVALCKSILCMLCTDLMSIKQSVGMHRAVDYSATVSIYKKDLLLTVLERSPSLQQMNERVLLGKLENVPGAITSSVNTLEFQEFQKHTPVMWAISFSLFFCLFSRNSKAWINKFLLVCYENFSIELCKNLRNAILLDFLWIWISVRKKMECFYIQFESSLKCHLRKPNSWQRL